MDRPGERVEDALRIALLGPAGELGTRVESGRASGIRLPWGPRGPGVRTDHFRGPGVRFRSAHGLPGVRPGAFVDIFQRPFQPIGGSARLSPCTRARGHFRPPVELRTPSGTVGGRRVENPSTPRSRGTFVDPPVGLRGNEVSSRSLGILAGYVGGVGPSNGRTRGGGRGCVIFSRARTPDACRRGAGGGPVLGWGWAGARVRLVDHSPDSRLVSPLGHRRP